MTDITVLKKGDKWVALFKFSYETKDRVKAAGFRWNPAGKEWFTTSPTIAASLSEEAREVAHNNVAASHAAQSSADIPSPDGLEYLPFQRAGIIALTQRANALLADEMGLGKTVQAIGLINAKPDIKRVLIVCPASLKINWKNELMRWLDRPSTILVLNSGDTWQACDIVVTNYEQVPRYRGAIDQVKWDLLIADESQYLKSAKAQRTQAIVGKWADDHADRIYPINARYRLFMTGTPILNRPKELWTTVRYLDRDGLGRDWKVFHERYCGGYRDEYGWQIDGATNLEELQNRLRSSIMIRRKKADVLTELPAKRRQLILLPADTLAAKHIIKAEQNDKEIAETEAELNRLRAEVERLSVNEASTEFKKAVQKLSTYELAAFEQMSKWRHETALAKLPAAMDVLVNVLENENKIVVFAHHHDVIDTLMEGLAEYFPVKIDGRDKVEDRQIAVNNFQSTPDHRVIIGSIGAMGVGWTLTAASYCAFVEIDWVPGNLAQAEDRLHRIGQAESVLVQHLMLDGSFDGRMAKSVINKMRVIERATG